MRIYVREVTEVIDRLLRTSDWERFQSGHNNLANDLLIDRIIDGGGLPELEWKSEDGIKSKIIDMTPRRIARCTAKFDREYRTLMEQTRTLRDAITADGARRSDYYGAMVAAVVDAAVRKSTVLLMHEVTEYQREHPAVDQSLTKRPTMASMRERLRDEWT